MRYTSATVDSTLLYIILKKQAMSGVVHDLEITIAHLQQALHAAQQAHASLTNAATTTTTALLTPPLVPVADSASVVSSTGSTTAARAQRTAYNTAWTDQLSRVSNASSITRIIQ